jgi:hypothetical protein
VDMSKGSILSCSIVNRTRVILSEQRRICFSPLRVELGIVL